MLFLWASLSSSKYWYCQSTICFLVCVCKSIQLILPLFVINAPFSKHSKLLQLLVMPLVSSLSTLSFLLFLLDISLISRIYSWWCYIELLSFLSCLSHMLVMTSHQTLSSFSFLFHLSHLQRWHCVPFLLCFSKLYHLLHLQRWHHVPFLLSFSTLSSFVSPLSFIFWTCNDGVTSPFNFLVFPLFHLSHMLALTICLSPFLIIFEFKA